MKVADVVGQTGNFQWERNADNGANAVGAEQPDGFPLNNNDHDDMLLNVDFALKWDFSTPNPNDLGQVG